MCLGKPLQGEEWERRYEFDASKLSQLPLPQELPRKLGFLLDALAREFGESAPTAVIGSWLIERDGSIGEALASAEAERLRLSKRLVFEQEELDWEVYRLYGLIEVDLTYSGSAIDGISSGQGLLRLISPAVSKRATEETAWFERHGSTPITELPGPGRTTTRPSSSGGLTCSTSDRGIRLLEKPEFKRRWATTGWDTQRTEALQAAILDRLEDPLLWRDARVPLLARWPRSRTLLRADPVLKELARALTGTAEPDLVR